MATVQVERMRDPQKLPSTKVKANPIDAEAKYKEIISKPPSVTSEAAIREYETALISLGGLYRDQKMRKEFDALFCDDPEVLKDSKAFNAYLQRYAQDPAMAQRPYPLIPLLQQTDQTMQTALAAIAHSAVRPGLHPVNLVLGNLNQVMAQYERLTPSQSPRSAKAARAAGRSRPAA